MARIAHTIVQPSRPKNVRVLIALPRKMSVTFDMPTQVNRFPGGWWSASKFVKAMRIIKTIGSTVKRTMVSMGKASSVT